MGLPACRKQDLRSAENWQVQVAEAQARLDDAQTSRLAPRTPRLPLDSKHSSLQALQPQALGPELLNLEPQTLTQAINSDMPAWVLHCHRVGVASIRQKPGGFWSPEAAQIRTKCTIYNTTWRNGEERNGATCNVYSSQWS